METYSGDGWPEERIPNDLTEEGSIRGPLRDMDDEPFASKGTNPEHKESVKLESMGRWGEIFQDVGIDMDSELAEILIENLKSNEIGFFIVFISTGRCDLAINYLQKKGITLTDSVKGQLSGLCG
jgi:hypothetical protein